MAEYSTSFTKHRAYGINKETLAEIVQVARTFLGRDLTISIHLQDDHKIEDTNLDTLLGDSYIKAIYIERIRVEGRNHATGAWDAVPRSISVDFQLDLMQSARVSISGERDRSITARSEIENILKTAEHRYSALFLPKRLPFFIASMTLPWIAVLALAIYATWLLGLEVRKDFISIWALPIAVSLAAPYLLLKGRLFPKLTFDIGRSANLAVFARYWRNFVFTSLLVGIALKLSIDHFLK